MKGKAVPVAITRERFISLHLYHQRETKLTKKKRAKNEPTKGDLLAQSYRNRAAMFRVYEAARNANNRIPYYKPFDLRTLGM